MYLSAVVQRVELEKVGKQVDIGIVFQGKPIVRFKVGDHGFFHADTRC